MLVASNQGALTGAVRHDYRGLDRVTATVELRTENSEFRMAKED